MTFLILGYILHFVCFYLFMWLSYDFHGEGLYGVGGVEGKFADTHENLLMQRWMDRQIVLPVQRNEKWIQVWYIYIFLTLTTFIFLLKRSLPLLSTCLQSV